MPGMRDCFFAREGLMCPTNRRIPTRKLKSKWATNPPRQRKNKHHRKKTRSTAPTRRRSRTWQLNRKQRWGRRSKERSSHFPHASPQPIRGMCPVATGPCVVNAPILSEAGSAVPLSVDLLAASWPSTRLTMLPPGCESKENHTSPRTR